MDPKIEWTHDVLLDLKKFAKQNGLPLFARSIEDASIVGRLEVLQTKRSQPNKQSQPTDDQNRLGR